MHSLDLLETLLARRDKPLFSGALALGALMFIFLASAVSSSTFFFVSQNHLYI